MRQPFILLLCILLLLSGCQMESGVYYEEITASDIGNASQGYYAFAKLHYDGRIYTSSEAYTLSDKAECPLEGRLNSVLANIFGNNRMLWSTEADELFEVTEDAVVCEVEGYDPSFLVCLYYELSIPDVPGRYQWIIFKCLNGITLDKGSDLFTNKYNIAESAAISALDNTSGSEYILSLEDAPTVEFISALNDGNFIDPASDQCPTFPSNEGITISFTDSVGITTNVTVYKDGYVTTKLFAQQTMTLAVDAATCKNILNYIHSLPDRQQDGFSEFS